MAGEPTTPSPRTRRAFLGATLGAIAAFVGQAVAKPDVAAAHDPDDVRKNALNTVNDTTELLNSTTTKTVFQATAFGSGTALKGVSDSGRGVHGKSASGYGGYFDGKVYTTRFYELTEIGEPGTPGGSRARIFLKEVEGVYQQVCVKFENGVVYCFANNFPAV